MKKLVYLFVLLMTVACNSDDSKSVEFLTLSSRQITTEPEGASQVITVNSSSDWTIDESSVPAWCTITEQTTAGFTITVLPNHTFIDREGKILTKNGATTNSITITQEGIENSPSLDWHTFPVNTFSKVNDTELRYTIEARSMFIPASMRSEIFHGNLIYKTFALGESAQPENNYTFNPITITAVGGGKAYFRESVMPSMEVTNGLFQEAIATPPTQSVLYKTSSPIQFNSYKHLHLLGVGNLGVNLDEIITGESYIHKEMGNRTGLIYTYSHLIFQASMDYPDKLIQEDLSETEADKLAYVDNVGYGKTAFLIVETDCDYDFSRAVINKIMKGETLNDEEKQIQDGITATYLYFQEDGSLNVSSGSQFISAYANEADKLPIVPLNFTVGNYPDSSVVDMEFSFPMP